MSDSSGTFFGRVLFKGGAPSDPKTTRAGVTLEVRADRVPDPALAGPIEAAWYWPEAGAAIVSHDAQVVVSASHADPIERALGITKAMAELAALPGAVAVTWDGDATEPQLLHDAAQWIEQSADANTDDLPLFLWLGFVGRESTETGLRNLRTEGMRAFGSLEVEVLGSRRDGEEVLEAVCDVALLALTSDAPIEDGEQVEISNGKVRVRIEPSSVNDGSKSYRLRLP